MRQFFIKDVVNINDTFTFENEQAFHISNVLRMKENDIVRIVDCHNQVFLCRLIFENGFVKGKITEKLDNQENVNVTLIAALIKKDNWELIIQKACELNASKIVPLITKRTIIHLDDSEIDKKLERWNKIAKEACQQSNRTIITEVCKPVKINQLEKYKEDINFVAYEKDDKNYLKNMLTNQNVSVIIGPEGGFEENEISTLNKMGFASVSLGNNILRAETACMYALSVIDAFNR